MLRYPLCVLGSLMLATTASSQTVPVKVDLVPTVTTPTPSSATTKPPIALSLEELEQQHGRQGVTVTVRSNQSLNATNSGNTINAGTVNSGDIRISDGAFAGFAGVGNFVVNSGHNNNLQGSLSITIVKP